MDLRELAAGDGQRLIELFRAVLPESPTALADGPDDAEVFLREPTTFAIAAYTDGEPIGLAWGIQMRSPSGRLTAYLHELDVREDHRRRGVGTALVRQAMDVARRDGSSKFWLSTGTHNEIAQGLYESLGGDRKPRGDVNYWWDLE